MCVQVEGAGQNRGVLRGRQGGLHGLQGLQVHSQAAWELGGQLPRAGRPTAEMRVRQSVCVHMLRVSRDSVAQGCAVCLCTHGHTWAQGFSHECCTRARACVARARRGAPHTPARAPASARQPASGQLPGQTLLAQPSAPLPCGPALTSQRQPQLPCGVLGGSSSKL